MRRSSASWLAAASLVLWSGTALLSQEVATSVRLGSSGAPSSLAALLDAVRIADILFVGERHDSRTSHVFELELLRAIAASRTKVSLALEMFERDAAEPVMHFGMGHLSEEELLAAVRPWPQYARDYKPMVDFAVSRDWTLVAGNVPRQLAAAVATGGLSALATRPDRERAWFARDLQCPTDDAYFARFQAAIHGQPESVLDPGAAGASPSADRASVERYYAAQCLKDETMAESIAASHAAGSVGGSAPLVVSINGSFHSDFGGGVVSRTRRRLPKARIVTISVVPIAQPTQATADAAAGRADYVVFVKGS